MVTIEQQLLGALLDRYEHSVGFVAGRGQQRRILLHLYGYRQNDFPLYDIDDSGARKAVNAAAQALASQGLVSVEWMPGQEGHILRRVALELSAVLQAYALAGRQPLSDIVTGLERQLTALSENVGADWARQYLQEQLDFLARNRRPSHGQH